jgi:hypothetical protein
VRIEMPAHSSRTPYRATITRPRCCSVFGVHIVAGDSGQLLGLDSNQDQLTWRELLVGITPFVYR